MQLKSITTPKFEKLTLQGATLWTHFESWGVYRNKSATYTFRGYDQCYLHFPMCVPSINQTSNILDDSVTQLGWFTIHIPANNNSISRLRQMLNELRELVRLNCPMGQVLSVFIVFCMHLQKAMQ